MKISRAVMAVNVCGTLGYMMLFAAWAFFVAILLALAFDTSAGSEVVGIVHNQGKPVSAEPSAVLVAASYVLTAVVVIISIGVVVTLPYFIGQWGSRIMRWLMISARIDVTRRQLFLVKCIVAALPLIGLLIVNIALMPESITFAAMYGATVGVVAMAIALFFVQLVLARRLQVPIKKLW